MTKDGGSPGAHDPAQRLRDMVLERNLVDTAALQAATLLAKKECIFLADALVRKNAIPKETVIALLGELHGVPPVDLDTTFGDPMVLDRLKGNRARELGALPLFCIGQQLTVAVEDPENLSKLDELRFITGLEILPCVALATDLRARIEESYGSDLGGGLAALEFDAAAGEDDESETYEVEAVEANHPVVRLLNLVLVRALDERASDVHLEPSRSRLAVRYRIDGCLQPKDYNIPLGLAPAVVSRVKVLSKLDITETRLPQDGKISLRYSGREVDVRVSTFPTILGEKVVMRLLDKDRMDFRLDTLGMNPRVRDSWEALIHRRNGIILVTGPTGSGKSSTLYATLRELHTPDVNIVTLEDPVEYQLDGLAQGQVNTATGFTFARGLRAILRQDPDIVLVGEIRDTETVQIAVQAALTGHLVLATLHTNDAPSAVVRLVDSGAEAHLVSAALLGVLAQRLVRRLCPECTEPDEPDGTERRLLAPWLAVPDLPFLRGTGCRNCRDTGFAGRVAVHETLSVSPQLRLLVSQGATTESITAAARQEGYATMWADGLDKVRARTTSLRELARVVEQDPHCLPTATASGQDDNQAA